ncbi:MAG TPA: HK97 family phage prohead protease [Bryobacteraceae bacterium]|nr:HK97 family phage prohead protease [Bryobacteraceae bacterium]
MKIIHKVSAEKNGMSFVMSDETPDRMGDVIVASGWDTTNFNKNPIALFGHRSDFPLGTWKNLRVEKTKLVGDLSLAPPGTSDRIDEVRRLVEADILKAVSVGFRDIESVPIDPKSPFGGMRFTKSELVECSLVAVPANPNALAISKSLNISPDVQRIVFAEQGTERRTKKHQELDDFIRLTTLDSWSPSEARKAKFWLAELAKQHPFNPLYRKMQKLMDEIETVRTVSLVSAEHGSKGRAI